jgi:hypothetical protein
VTGLVFCFGEIFDAGLGHSEGICQVDVHVSANHQPRLTALR